MPAPGDMVGVAAGLGVGALAFAGDYDPAVVGMCIAAVLYYTYRMCTVKAEEHPGALPLPVPDLQADDMSKPKVAILFGSQTGTSELYARNLAREAKKMGYRVELDDLLDYDTASLVDEQFVIFIVSTYGEGEPTDTMKDFYNWYMDDERKESPSEDFSKVKFAVFGLGDTQYKHFCQMGHEFDTRSAELEMQRVCAVGLGDSDQNLEEDFDNWRAELWAKAGPIFGIEPRDEFAEPPEVTLSLRAHESKVGALPFPKTASSLPPTQKLPCWATLTRSDELLAKPGEKRSTRHMEFDVSESSLASEQGGRYEGGDHLGILPANDDATVDEYTRALRLSAAQLGETVSLVAADGLSKRNHLPSRVPVKLALKWYFDLQGAPKKATLRVFTHYCADPAERAAFQSLLRINEESAQRFRAAAAELRTVAGFLRRFPSTTVPVDVFMEQMPRTQPRWYSIASDSLWETQRKSIHACVALTDGGLCSAYLRSLPLGAKVPCFVRKSTFHLPQRDKSRPCIMIGPGTGVAPLVGFLFRRKAWQQKGEKLGETLFYFGCRSRSDDWLYQDLMNECQQSGIISKLRVAFSRDQEKKVYVQHLLKEDARDVWRLISQGANIYICGDAKRMAKDVEETLVQIMIGEGGMDRAAAEKKLVDKEKRSEFLKDVWTS